MLEGIQAAGGVRALKKVDRSQIRDRSGAMPGGEASSGGGGAGAGGTATPGPGPGGMADALALALKKRKEKVSGSGEYTPIFRHVVLLYWLVLTGCR
jgi:Wiskott-Aldrich syndrome protein